METTSQYVNVIQQETYRSLAQLEIEPGTSLSESLTPKQPICTLSLNTQTDSVRQFNYSIIWSGFELMD